MPLRQALAFAVALTAVVAFATAGCGSDDNGDTATSAKPAPAALTVDSSAVEGTIKTKFSTSAVKVSSVKCPDDVKSEAGATFKCDVKWSNGATGKVKVMEKSLNQFAYEIVSGSVQIPGASVNKTLEKRLAQQGAPNATVNCPQNIVVKVGTTVTCDVSGAGGKATSTVTFSFSSDSGEVDPSSVETS
jgi:hypothetical protein